MPNNNTDASHTPDSQGASSTQPPKQDKFAEREAQNYENPVPSREFLLDFLEAAQGPLTHPQVCEQLGIDDEERVEALRRRLIAMSRDGQLMSNRRGAFGVINKLDLIHGKVQGHKDGYGFLIQPKGEDDIYLTNNQMRKVMDGDEVLVRIQGEDRRGRKEGVIVEVVARNTQAVVGRLFRDGDIWFVRPDNPRIVHDVMIAKGDRNKAKEGQFVVATITQQPSRKGPPSGEVSDILGEHMAPGMEIDVAIRSHDIPHQWPSDVVAETQKIPEEVEEADKTHRVDLRELPFVTIDGEDARDFDDAVYCTTKKSGGWRLYVAIADVSHYVAVNSALDTEAISRGNSVYFPDYVVPMLPEALSNGLCSLNPQVDRLCMVCEMTISAAGKLSGYKFYEGIIHSHARLTYTQVGKVIEERDHKRSGVRKQLNHLLTPLDTLHDLYKALRANREARGAIDFDTVETRIIFDAERKIDQIVPVQRNDAHKLIEECMLCANVCAARLLDKSPLDILYRVHEGPANEKLENLRQFMGEIGLPMKGRGQPKPADYQALLSAIEGRPDAHLIQTVMLRSLSQAKYQPDNLGHFGLAFTAYTHFTSPIRRYPDLIVHRAIRYLLRAGKNGEELRTGLTRNLQPIPEASSLPAEQIFPYDTAGMLQLGEHFSLTERRADDATREVVSWLKCEFLQSRIGDEFDGVISAVTGFGLFVELKDLYVEGLVHISNLPGDYYHYEQAHHRLVGERTRQVYRLGDQLRVQVANVNLDERKVDFELISAQPRKQKVSKKAQSLAEDYAQELERKQGKLPRKRPTKASKPSAEEKAPAKPARKKAAASKSASTKKVGKKKPRSAVSKTTTSNKTTKTAKAKKPAAKKKPSKGKRVRKSKTVKK